MVVLIPLGSAVRQRLGKKAAALLKTQVGRFVNMILHPNVQLRDREAIH